MFQLQNDPPRPKRWTGEPAPKSRQRVLFSGLGCLPDQQDLFPTDGADVAQDVDGPATTRGDRP
ncbi:MAG TPA: hypothetical protein VMY42_17775 [Thermoguttaceae bacterium]|nr:hypothetical protein [Thermoguttaceae bacterium]HUX16043.1 hypothetical protein [Phycisphaerae bacterium]